MAESLLFSVAGSLVRKLASPTLEEASMVVGVYDDLREVKDSLSLIKAVLLDAEKKQQQNHELREWLRQIKHVLSDAENIIDDFECEALRKRVVKANGSNSRKVSRFFSSSNPLAYRVRMGHEIKDIKKRLDKVAADRHNFGLQTNDIDTRVVHTREMSHSHVNESHVIGREPDKKKILKLLLQDDDDDDENNLSVLPIVGIGGLGKTTLAKSLFNDKRIDETFTLKMWVCVSDNFELHYLLVKILHSAIYASSDPTLTHLENFKNLEVEQLQNHLRSALAGQKFLLVLDDMWNEDRVKWIELKDLIQVGAKGSKVLVTTRSLSIATMMHTKSSYSYILEGLSEDDSLALFVKWAFQEGDDKKSPNLVEIGKEIVKKCRGLPLTVRTLGSLLFLKVDGQEWEFIRDSEIWNLPQKEYDILPALKLSYDQLPSHLKQCFASFSLFEKDYRFHSSQMTALWGALGFLPSPKKGKILEDVGIQFLYELKSRSFVQDFFNFGNGSLFSTHDLVHDLALYVANNEFQLLSSENHNISDDVQHISFTNKDLLGPIPMPTGLRTILLPVKANNEAFLHKLVSTCKYLRVLDLCYSEYESLPHSIGKLKHLRCLMLRHNRKLKRLPNSLCKLQNLQTLWLYGCTELQSLPRGIRNLVSLRELSITTKQKDFPSKEIEELASLEFLSLSSCSNLESLFEGRQLPGLKELNIFSCDNLMTLPLDAFPNLESLRLQSCGKLEFPSAATTKSTS